MLTNLSQIIFVSDGSDTPTVCHPRVVVKVGADSHLSFTQGYISQGGVCLSNGFTRILLGNRANVVRSAGTHHENNYVCVRNLYGMI